MAKVKQDTRSKKEKDAYNNTLDAGLNYVDIKSLGDTSELKQQAKTLEQYAINQGIDPEKDLNGLPRHVKLYSEIVPETQKRERESLIKTVTENFDYLTPQLSADILLQAAVHLGKTEAERGLEKILTESPNETEKVKKAFGKLYDPSALIQSYIALNNNPEEITQCATGALKRSYARRVAEFQYLNKGKPVINKRKLIPYITEQIEKAEQENVNEAMAQIGLLLAMKKIMAEQAKAQPKTE